MQELIDKLKTLVNIFTEKRDIETEAEVIHKEFEKAFHHAVMEDISNPPTFSYSIENNKNTRTVLMITNQHATLYLLPHSEYEPITQKGYVKYEGIRPQNLYTLKEFFDHLPEYIDQIDNDIEEKRKAKDDMAVILERIKDVLAPLLVAEKLSQ